MKSEAPAAPQRVLPAIVIAQLLGASPWFAVNAVMLDLQRATGWVDTAVATLTSALQLGFIAGTLVFALLAVADRFATRSVFLWCALASAACTLAAVPAAASFEALLASRALTGFFLAGIYPIGMKLAAQWFPRGLGTALGWLIGALVLGSASPHALRALAASGAAWPWHSVFFGAALASVVAGLMVILAVPAAPKTVGRPAGLHLSALASVWHDRRLRASAFGYFGHMVELYTMWVLVPLILATRLAGAALSWWAFAVLGAGALGCVAGGVLARRCGSARVAAAQLATSGLCCLLAPLALAAPLALFLAWLLLWGVTVAGDSPQFSALTATNAPPAAVGSVLTLVNSIGFAISVLSIEFFVRLAAAQPLAATLPWIAIGPALGLVMLRPLLRRR
ncbi:MFS transporter [Rivibacter subsaxonicus]|uniref:MFS transporter n=1 Tax=Rivibacter subsaxonicus TaxID=457575 RepID=A0A4Q7VA22_9BURK|nr:MFS transporter [Rivibacter subsaxonicus]RZT92577.1 MFS transporter [Rivibacter subsaxonicus]